MENGLVADNQQKCSFEPNISSIHHKRMYSSPLHSAIAMKVTAANSWQLAIFRRVKWAKISRGILWNSFVNVDFNISQYAPLLLDVIQDYTLRYETYWETHQFYHTMDHFRFASNIKIVEKMSCVMSDRIKTKYFRCVCVESNSDHFFLPQFSFSVGGSKLANRELAYHEYWK